MYAIRSYYALSEHPAGRLPELVRACRMSGFSLSSMKNLLMFRAFIWKNAEAAASLVRFGIENRCIKNTSDRPSGDEWAKRLKVSGGSLYAFYTGLKIRIGKICGSSSFAELSKEFQIFIRITSYNVCYTKLLRPSIRSAFRQES